MFCTDADLLAYEPSVFVDLPFAAQRKLRATDAVIDGAQVTSAAGGFTALAADEVLVVAVDSPYAVAFAVESVTDDHTLTLIAAPVGLTAMTDVTIEARTFAPQAALVHAELLRAIGIDSDDPGATIDADDVVSVELMRRLEVLGTLARAYAAAITPGGDNAAVERKAGDYHRRFERAVRGARVLIDTDGDGEADQWRCPGVGRLVRG